jgi:hypothetical protein
MTYRKLFPVVQLDERLVSVTVPQLQSPEGFVGFRLHPDAAIGLGQMLIEHGEQILATDPAVLKYPLRGRVIFATDESSPTAVDILEP